MTFRYCYRIVKCGAEAIKKDAYINNRCGFDQHICLFLAAKLQNHHGCDWNHETWSHGCTPNHPKLDYLSIESHGDLGIPHFKKAPYRRMTKHCCPMDLRFSSVSYPKFSPPPAVSSV